MLRPDRILIRCYLCGLDHAQTHQSSISAFLPHVRECPVMAAHVEDNPLDSFDPLYLGFFNIWRNVFTTLKSWHSTLDSD